MLYIYNISIIINMQREITRGAAVKRQLGMWDRLLESRIRIQRVLSLVNCLPQPDIWTMLDKSGQDFLLATQHGRQQMTQLLKSVVELQSMLQDISTTQTNYPDHQFLHSDEMHCHNNSFTHPLLPPLEKLTILHKYKILLDEQHSYYRKFRDSVIAKWSDKIYLGNNSKSFSAFNHSAAKQIKQIMSETERLLTRTQIKRSVYQIIGKVGRVSTEADGSKDLGELPQITNDADSEVFDDDDFYHQLLRQLIQQKSIDTTDPDAFNRHLIHIQRLRSKVRRSVDTSASKGRKLRYNVQQKMVSFMAPADNSLWTGDSRDDLFKSLFGKDLNQAHDKMNVHTINSTRII